MRSRLCFFIFFVVKHKTAYEMRISDWSSDVCSSDLIKCSKADLLGDAKWLDYLEYCDRYFWAAPSGFDLSLFESEALLPKRTGLIAADQYDAEILRSAPTEALAVARRKAETLRLGRRATRRLMAMADPDYIREISGI